MVTPISISGISGRHLVSGETTAFQTPQCVAIGDMSANYFLGPSYCQKHVKNQLAVEAAPRTLHVFY